MRRSFVAAKLWRRSAAPSSTRAMATRFSVQSRHAKRKMIVPVLIGPEKKIRAVASTENFDLARYQIVSTEHNHAAAQKAIELARG